MSRRPVLGSIGLMVAFGCGLSSEPVLLPGLGEDPEEDVGGGGGGPPGGLDASPGEVGGPAVVSGPDGGAADAGGIPEVDLERELAVRIAFDETSGTGAAAVSTEGAVNGRIPVDAVWRPQEGRRGGALQLTGSHVALGNSNRYFPRETPFTVTLWVSRMQASEAATLFVFHPGPLIEVTWGAATLSVRAQRESLGQRSTGDSIDGWHMIAVTYTYSDRQVRAYWDGLLFVDVTRELNAPNPQNAAIGEGFIGLVDELRVYRRALEPDEIRALFERGE